MAIAGRKKRDWLQNIQEGKMREIAKLFFLTFITKSQATKILYKDRIKKREDLMKRKNLSSIGYVAPEITKRVKEWERLGFIEKSRIKVSYLEKTAKGKKEVNKETKPTYAYLMTLEPLYFYCKEKFDIEFQKEEKEFLNGINGLFRPEQTRILIYNEYRKEDLISAILKFYVKHYILPYGYLMRLSNSPHSLSPEAKKEIGEAKERAIEVNERKKDLFLFNKNFKEFKKDLKETHKLFSYLPELKEKDIKSLYSIMQEVTKETNKREYDFIDVLIHKPEFSQQYLEDGFITYKRAFDKNPKMILEIDSKFMKALGILPS